MSALRVASILSALSLVATQPVPLPNLPDGFRVGTGGPVVETFMDMLCPDCAGDWPTMGALRAFYGNKISFVLHTCVMLIKVLYARLWWMDNQEHPRSYKSHILPHPFSPFFLFSFFFFPFFPLQVPLALPHIWLPRSAGCACRGILEQIISCTRRVRLRDNDVCESGRLFRPWAQPVLG